MWPVEPDARDQQSRDSGNTHEVVDLFRSLVERSPDVVAIVDAAGSIQYVNRAVEAFGYRPDALVGANVFARIHPDDLAGLRTVFTQVQADSGPTLSVEFRLLHGDDSWRWMAATCYRFSDADASDSVVVDARDITDRKQTEARLAEAELQFRRLAEHLPAATYIESLDGTQVSARFMSPRIEEITGYPASTWTTTADFWDTIIHPDDRHLRDAARAASTANPDLPYRAEYRAHTHDGRTIWVRNESVLMHDDEGNPLHWQGFITDITAQKDAELALQASEQRLRDLIEHIPAVTYTATYDRETGVETLQFSQQMEAWTGYVPDDLPTIEEWANVVHLDDRQRVIDEAKRTDESGEPYHVECRLITRDGGTIWVRNDAVLAHSDGHLDIWQGFIFDITARKEAELAVLESELRLRDVIENIPAITYTYSLDRVSGKAAMRYSPQLQSWTGYTVEELNTMDSALALVHPDDRERVAAEADRTDATGEPFHVEHRILTKDGKSFWVRNDAILARRDERADIWQGFYSDITDRKELEILLAHQVFHDSLTGLPNRVLFAERVEHALAKSARHGGRVGVLFLDLDGFKQVNDSAGHRVGDELLVEAGQRMLASIRPGDTVARMGGDEFTILLDEVASLDEAETVAARVLETIEPPFTTNGREYRVSASIGIAQSEGPNDDAPDLIRRADIAMYEAKHSGKARYAIFDSQRTVMQQDRDFGIGNKPKAS